MAGQGDVLFCCENLLGTFRVLQWSVAHCNAFLPMSMRMGKRTTTQQESNIPSLQRLQIVADIYFNLDSETSVQSTGHRLWHGARSSWISLESCLLRKLQGWRDRWISGRKSCKRVCLMHSSFSHLENASNENHKLGEVAIHWVTSDTAQICSPRNQAHKQLGVVQPDGNIDLRFSKNTNFKWKVR